MKPVEAPALSFATLAPAVQKLTPSDFASEGVFLYLVDDGKEMTMRNKKNYPANLLNALHLNDLLGTDVDYENLTEDQIKGADYILSMLTERERIVLDHYYKSAVSRKWIAERYHLTKKRVRQIIYAALKKLQIRELLLYAAEGFDFHRRRMEEQLRAEESRFCKTRGIMDRTHLFYQEIERLNLPVKIERALQRGNVRTVRELLITICAARRVYQLGEGSIRVVSEILKRENLMPEDFQESEIPVIPQIDMEAIIFQRINLCENGRESG